VGSRNLFVVSPRRRLWSWDDAGDVGILAIVGSRFGGLAGLIGAARLFFLSLFLTSALAGTFVLGGSRFLHGAYSLTD
jgi:hypothetical protein